MSNTNDLFNEKLQELLQGSKKPKEKTDFQLNLEKLKKDAEKKKPKTKQNGAGYEYVNDPETGRLRTRSQIEWEKYHAPRKVEEHQRVFFKNGNKKDFSKENLILGYKHGIPLDALTCSHCGHRGMWSVDVDLT